MNFLNSIGEAFQGLTNPIDLMMTLMIQMAVEGLSYILAGIVNLTKLGNGFEDIDAIKDIFTLCNYFVGLLVGAIAVYHVFQQILNMITAKNTKSPQELFGDMFNYGWRLLSMPYFLFFGLKLNSIWINMITDKGLNSQNLIKMLGLKNNDSFLKAISKMFAINAASNIVTVIAALLLLISFAVLYFHFIKRSGEIVFMYIFIPIVALSSISTDFDLYSTWWKNAIGIIFTQALQVTGLYLSIQLVLDGHGVFGIGVLLATISTPMLVKEFAHNAGVTSSLKSLAMIGAQAR
ncbi:conjugal transfer protein TrbL family protein [Listeria seeligeri]|uniref:conjugal transfer protein TrbL family protein n=1 Tax=Listeria seeligeri TaxID=1640 RepID=UPI0010AF8EA6|nr:conjugal transfer protein TrbL family protein [Listeria seeligeri]EAC2922389.1 hypothetical protein [Listeria monocytogenes]MBC1557007.1 hypothetical protein [Listeria seeligeri]HAB0718273.1 hypothetical protein [Listeria monocytogenes]